MEAAGTYELKYKNYNHEHNFLVLFMLLPNAALDETNWY